MAARRHAQHGLANSAETRPKRCCWTICGGGGGAFVGALGVGRYGTGSATERAFFYRANVDAQSMFHVPFELASDITGHAGVEGGIVNGDGDGARAVRCCQAPPCAVHQPNGGRRGVSLRGTGCRCAVPRRCGGVA